MKTKNVLLFFIMIFIMMLSLSHQHETKKRGYESILINNSNIYLNAYGNKVEYYRIPKFEILNCEELSSDGNSYLCAWYFSKNQEPLWGWVSSKDLIFDYKNWRNNGKSGTR